MEKTRHNNVMRAKPDLRVVFDWMLTRSGSVNPAVIRLQTMAQELNWPADAYERQKLLVRFLLDVLRQSETKFDELARPCVFAERFVNDEADREEMQHHAGKYWDLLRSNNQISDFSTIELLVARIAICLLNRSSDDPNEDLDWIFELLDMVDREINSEFYELAGNVFESKYAKLLQ